MLIERYWINTASRDHVRTGVEGEFTRANDGRAPTLRKLERGDLLAFYSPRTRNPEGETLQHLTAIGRIADDAPYQTLLTPEFAPWRRRVEYLSCEEAPIRDLLGELTFFADPKRWGFVFRRGLFEIGAADFQRIAHAMNVDLRNL